MNQKKAVSAVVATVLIIMITVAAVAIIWTAIMPMVRNSIQKGNACFDAQSDVAIGIDSGRTCLNSSADNGNGTVYVQVKKGASDKFALVGLDVSVSVAGNSYSERIKEEYLPGNNEDRVVNVTGTVLKHNISMADRVKIAPIVSIGNTEEICDVSQEVILTPCR